MVFIWLTHENLWFSFCAAESPLSHPLEFGLKQLEHIRKEARIAHVLVLLSHLYHMKVDVHNRIRWIYLSKQRTQSHLFVLSFCHQKFDVRMTRIQLNVLYLHWSARAKDALQCLICQKNWGWLIQPWPPGSAFCQGRPVVPRTGCVSSQTSSQWVILPKTHPGC